MAEKKHTLYNPETGEKYETTDKVEATRLQNGYGYTTQAPKSSKSTSDKS